MHAHLKIGALLRYAVKVFNNYFSYYHRISKQPKVQLIVGPFHACILGRHFATPCDLQKSMAWVKLRQKLTVTQNVFISSMNERVKSSVVRIFDVDQKIR